MNWFQEQSAFDKVIISKAIDEFVKIVNESIEYENSLEDSMKTSFYKGINKISKNDVVGKSVKSFDENLYYVELTALNGTLHGFAMIDKNNLNNIKIEMDFKEEL